MILTEEPWRSSDGDLRNFIWVSGRACVPPGQGRKQINNCASTSEDKKALEEGFLCVTVYSALQYIVYKHKECYCAPDFSHTVDQISFKIPGPNPTYSHSDLVHAGNRKAPQCTPLQSTLSPPSSHTSRASHAYGRNALSPHISAWLSLMGPAFTTITHMKHKNRWFSY